MPKPRDTEPNCPARLARFRLELDNTHAEPGAPLPCTESIERPGRCVHCQQAIERAAGAPHGPYCTGDSRCRECRRLLLETRAAAVTAVLWSPAELAAASDRFRDEPAPELPAALLEEWRADAVRWQADARNWEIIGVTPPAETRIATQRIVTLIDALNASRRVAGELGAEALARASELEQRLEAIRVALASLTQQVTAARR